MSGIRAVTLNGWFRYAPIADGELKQLDPQSAEGADGAYMSLHVEGVDYVVPVGKKANCVGMGYSGQSETNPGHTPYYSGGEPKSFNKNLGWTANNTTKQTNIGTSTAADSSTGFSRWLQTPLWFLYGASNSGAGPGYSNPYFYAEMEAGQYITIHNNSGDGTYMQYGIGGYGTGNRGMGSGGMWILEVDV